MTSMILLKAGASLLIVVGLMLLLVYTLKFLQGKKRALTPQSDRITVSQVNHVTAKQKIMVVQWGGKENLIALTPNGGFLIDQKNTNIQGEKYDAS